MDCSKDVVATRILGKGPQYLRKQIDREGETKGGPSAVERLAASRPQYVKSQPVVAPKPDPVPVVTFSSASVSSNESSNRSSNPGINNVQSSEQEENRDVVRRTSSKKQRPDSILVYRQRCENTKIATSDNSKARLIRRFFHSPLRDKASALPVATAKECDLREKGVGALQSEKTGKTASVRKEVIKENLQILDKPRVGVNRSHSDISSRYSKNFSEFETFFKYCGLDKDVIESLGKENFSAQSDELSVKIRSVSVSTSEDGFTRKSDDMDDGLNEELTEKNRQNTSVIERNARIIKWLYSCKNATESGKVLRDLE